MSAVVEWSVPFELATPLGSLPFNTPLYGGTSLGPYLYLDQTKCKTTPGPLRVVTDDVPQADGTILHKTFKHGYTAHLGFELWQDFENAVCGAELVDAWDYTVARINSLVRPPAQYVNSGQTQLRWTPTDHPVRMIDRIEVLEWIDLEFDGPIVVGSVDFHSPLPYALAQTQLVTPVPATLVNLGSSEMFPVIKVYGPVTTPMTLTNTTTGLKIKYDPSLPGAINIASYPNYAEISTFTGTVFLDGSGTNLEAGIDFTVTDFFSLVPGPNVITQSGPGTVEILWQDAYS